MVDFVQRVRSQPVKDGKRRTVAVLSRRRKDISDDRCRLREAGIPTEIVGLGGLLDQPAVQDVRAALGWRTTWRPPRGWRLLASDDLGAAPTYDNAGDWARFLARACGTESSSAVLLDTCGSSADAQVGRRGRLRSARRRCAACACWAGACGRSVRAWAFNHGAGRARDPVMGTLDDVIADPLSMGGRAALDEFIAVTAAYEKETPGASLGGCFLAYLDYGG